MNVSRVEEKKDLNMSAVTVKEVKVSGSAGVVVVIVWFLVFEICMCSGGGGGGSGDVMAALEWKSLVITSRHISVEEDEEK